MPSRAGQSRKNRCCRIPVTRILGRWCRGVPDIGVKWKRRNTCGAGAGDLRRFSRLPPDLQRDGLEGGTRNKAAARLRNSAVGQGRNNFIGQLCVVLYRS